MAISLKNVNDRLTIVESRTLNNELTTLATVNKFYYNGTINIPTSEPISNFLFVVIEQSIFDNPSPHISTISITAGDKFYLGIPYGGDYANDGLIVNVKNSVGNNINITFDSTYVGKIYGYIRKTKTLYYKVLEQIKYLFKEVLS